MVAASRSTIRQDILGPDTAATSGWVQFLRDDPRFARAWSRHFHELSVARWLIEPQQMQPVAAAENWGIPEIESPGALAEWFGISTGELRWFSDLKGLGYKKGPLSPEAPSLPEQSGNIRLIEAPKPRLKELQRQVLSRILESVSSSRLCSRVLERAFDQDLRRSPRWAADYLTHGFAGFFSFLFRRKNSELLPHDGLIRTGCRSARRNLHERDT